MQEKLEAVLKKTADYCARLDQVALYFVCTEEVAEKIYNPFWRVRVFAKNDYLYDYQLIRRDSDINERRILLGENGRARRIENAPLKTQRFDYKYLIFGPNGVLGSIAQLHNDYSLEAETQIWGHPAVIVKSVPRDPGPSQWLYGKAWVSPTNGSVYKIEWEEKSLGNFEEALDFAKKSGLKPAINFSTEYEYEKNGIRFPSRYRINEDYYPEGSSSGRRLRKSELNVLCRDYKFFTVETEIKSRD